ncbi:MAG: hypothetical protein HEEMFOPI_01136 [Holosporales bacterium]
MKLNKIVLLSALGCFALPIMAEDAPKAEEAKLEAKAEVKADAKSAKKVKAKGKKKAHKGHKGHKAHVDACHAGAPALPTAPTVAAAPVASDAPTLKFGGWVRAILNYDLNGFGGDFLKASVTPFDNANSVNNSLNSNDKKVFSGNVKATRLTAEANAKSSFGDVKGYLESDLYQNATMASYINNANNGNDNSTALNANSSSSGATGLRVRKAYVKVGGFMAGQDDSLFNTYPVATMLDYSGHMGSGFRTMQARYTYAADAWNIALGLEKSNTIDVSTVDGDLPFITIASGGTQFAGSVDNGLNGVTQKGNKQNVPDVTFKVGGKVAEHEFGFRSVWKSAKVWAKNATTTYAASTNGWGVGFDAKIKTMKDSALVAIVNYGKGIGSRINEFSDYGQSFVWANPLAANASLNAQKMLQWGLGYNQAFNDNWKASVGYSQDKLTADSNVVTQKNNINGKLERYFANVRFQPAENVSLGLEYAKVKATSIDGTASGSRDRVVFAVQYNF